MSAGLSWNDVAHAGVRGLIATALLVPCGLWAVQSYDAAAAVYAFAVMHFLTGNLAVAPLIAFLGLLAVPAALVERRYGDRDSAKQHVTLLGLTTLVTLIGLWVIVIQASYVAALWQLGLSAGWGAAADRLREMVRLVPSFPVDSLLLSATFATPFLVVGTIRTHHAGAGRLLASATAFTALLAALIYMSVAPETQHLPWLRTDAWVIGRPRLIATWAALIGGLAFVLSLSALIADRLVPRDGEGEEMGARE